MIIPRYCPGPWFAVVTGRGIALLAPQTEPAVVEQVWQSLRDGADTTEQLQLLLGAGFAAMPPFALVTVVDGTARAIVRGGATVTVRSDGPERTVSGSGASTWVEESVAEAAAVTVRAPVPDDDGPRLPIRAAVVMAAEVSVELVAEDERGVAAAGTTSAGPGSRRRAGRASSASIGGTPEPSPEPEPAPVPEPAPEPEPEPAPEPEPEPAPEPEPEPAPEPEPEPESESEPTSEPEPAPEPAPAAGQDELGEAEVTILSPAQAPPPPPPADHAPAFEPPLVLGDQVSPDDHDGLTVLTSDLVALRAQMPDTSPDDPIGPLAVPSPDAPPPARIVLSSGMTVALNRPVLIGRAPQVSRVPNAQLPRLVTVPSPNHDISRTHAQVRQDGDDVVVTDLNSTNGVTLVADGGTPRRLHPGDPTVVEPGCVVDLGDGVTFAVERGS